MTILRTTCRTNNERYFWRWLVMVVLALCLWLPSHAFAAGSVNIYSHRQQVLIQPFLNAFTKSTSIQTKTVYAAKVLAQRLQAEGMASPADVILTVDIARLAEYAALDLLAPIESEVIAANMPEHLRASDNRWFGLYERARILVTSKDRAQAKAIFQGICDVAIMNSYFYGNMKCSDGADQRLWADSLRLVFTNEQNRGNHINISGAGVAKHSPNRKEALAFLEFLTGEVAQQLYGTINYEHPVNPAVVPPAELASWGVFKLDALPIEKLAELAPEAQKIIDRVGW